MAGNTMLLEVINVVVLITQVLIGVALIAGATQMSAFYLGGWERQWLALFDSTLIYAVVFLAIVVFGAGRILGPDRYIEQIKVGGQTFVQRFPKLRYVLS
jgi:thiosulfate dehydrogenase (quinone) large subunit